MNKYFENGYSVSNLSTLKSKLIEVNSLLAELLDLDSSQRDFFERVHEELVKKFQNRDLYFGFLKAFTNSPIVQSVSADPELLDFVKNCGIRQASLVTPPILHVVAKDLIVDASKVFTPPHQDVVSTKGSVGQVVVWIPLHDVEFDNFGISAIPGSHKMGLLETQHSGFGHTVKSDLISDLSSEYLTLEFGDAVVFSQYLVHHTHTIGEFRMALSFRFNDMTDADWIDRSYFVSFERVPITTKFEDNREQPPSDNSHYFKR
jgi:hypothetical protein